MTLKHTLEDAVRYLETNFVGSPRMNAEVLLMFTLGCDRACLFAHPERELTTEESTRLAGALAERARGVPAQYITGHQEFWGLDLIVTPAVLIPRPETEHIIETVLELANPGAWNRDLHIVDVGTGSGCIALALASELPQARLLATDISEAALEIARANATRLQLTDRIFFQQADLLAHVAAPAGGFDFVVSNPPYVGESEADQVQLEVRKFEPRQAVFAGLQGLDVIERLIPEAQRVLKPGGWFVFEIGCRQETAVRVRLEAWAEVRLIHDLQGLPRTIAARTPSE